MGLKYKKIIIASEASFLVSSMARIFYINNCERSELSCEFNGKDFLNIYMYNIMLRTDLKPGPI